MCISLLILLKNKWITFNLSRFRITKNAKKGLAVLPKFYNQVLYPCSDLGKAPFNTCRFKSSELKTVPLSRIARKNLMNIDDATIYNNEENHISCSASIFDEPYIIFIRNLK